MKYRPAQYAQALHSALKDAPISKQKEIIRRFAALLGRHRMSGKSDLVIAAYEKIVLRETGMRKVRIESAAPASEQLKKEIQAVLGKKIFIEAKTNPELLAGIKILVDDELLIDASAKRQLERIFQK
ncbi:MAG: F0F1 ATP synthase subunit delta [Candidatus Sungbacteria bacterium]|nr:F0F1 ATP synthase subunit delta [Candidatus Sungbacteria bacterium]